MSNYWGNILFQRMLKSDSLRAALDSKIEEYRTALSAELLSKKARQYASVVEQYAYSYPDNEYMLLTQSQYEEMLGKLPQEVENNYALYKQSLEKPMPFFIAKPEKNSDGIKFAWDTSYDFNEETITYSLEVANDYSFLNPIIKEEGLFVPEYTYQGNLPAGQYFVRVKAVNESGNEQGAFDYYVTGDNVKQYAVKCIYVLDDGSIVEDIYEE